jgi:hypothetical protein
MYLDAMQRFAYGFHLIQRRGGVQLGAGQDGIWAVYGPGIARQVGPWSLLGKVLFSVMRRFNVELVGGDAVSAHEWQRVLQRVGFG